MKKLTLLLLMLIASIATYAYDVQINGIYYNLNNSTKTAEVAPALYSNEYSGEVEIPTSFSYNGITYTVTEIGDNAFFGRSLSSILIPNSVTTIGTSAFEYCNKLTTINIPNSVTNIKNYAVKGCM